MIDSRIGLVAMAITNGIISIIYSAPDILNKFSVMLYYPNVFNLICNILWKRGIGSFYCAWLYMIYRNTAVVRQTSFFAAFPILCLTPFCLLTQLQIGHMYKIEYLLFGECFVKKISTPVFDQTFFMEYIKNQ